MILSTLPLLTAALVASTTSTVTEEDNASTAVASTESTATLQDGSFILVDHNAEDLFQAFGACPATASAFTVETAIFPGDHNHELESGIVNSFLQSCLSLARKKPAKAFNVCTQLASLSYVTLSSLEGVTGGGRNYGKRSQVSKRYPSDNQGASASSFMAQGEQATPGNMLHRLREGLADIVPFSSFASGSRKDQDIISPSHSPSFRSEARLTANVWNPWKFETESRSTTGGDSLVQERAVNLSTLFCRSLAEFHAEGYACGVMKFVKASLAAPHRSPPCARGPKAAQNLFVHATASARTVLPETVCSEGVQGAVELPLLSFQEYRSILSLNERSTHIPSQVLEREGLTYSHLWEAIDHLYQFHRKTQCLSDGYQVPCFLPGWTPVLLLDLTEPRLTHSNPLCVFARRGKSLLVVIRGALTSAEWALCTEYELTDFAPGRGESVGKVSTGVLKIYAAIWPALQTFLVNSKMDAAVERILITGHSMGAAVGTLLSAALAASFLFKKRVDAVLFASPRSGDVRFMDFWRNHVNGRAVQFYLDVITGLPCARMPVCDARKLTHTYITALGSRSSQLDRSPQMLAHTKRSSSAYEYGDYPNSAVFEPTELPNAPDQEPAHIRYNHFCAYACWLATRFDTSRKESMCNKTRDVSNLENDPSVCPKL